MAGKGKQKSELQVEVKTQEQWNNLLEKPGLVVVDAYAAWCGPCKAIISMFRRIKNELGDDLLNFAIAETDSIESLRFYKGKSKPTFLFFGGGTLVYVIRGCNGPLLERMIRACLDKEHKILDGQGEREIFIDPEIEAATREEKADTPKPGSEAGVEEEDEMELVDIPKEVAVAIIKPDAVQQGRVEEILKMVEEAGIQILQKEERMLTKEEAAEFYKQHEGTEHFEQLIEFMSSGPCLTLVLSKEGDSPGYGFIPELRDLLGPKDVNIAKEEAPSSIRAQFGTDEIQNAVHGCDSAESAARELAFFFPNYNVPTVQEKRKKKQLQRTLALIRPGALMKRKDSIVRKIEEAGFVIAMSKEMHLSKEQAEQFYSDHKDQDYFENLVTNMTSGPCMALCLAREEAVETWRNVLGPKDVNVAKEEAPESFRAVFADEDSDINPIHGADSIATAEKEIQHLFPIQSTVAVIKPEAYSEPEQKELVISKIQEAGFKISAQKEVTLTKDLAAQFYKEHEGKEFFDNLTDYMSSGPTLFLVLSKEDAVHGFRALMGPTKPDVAKDIAPTSLRAQLAQDEMRNAVHGSSNTAKAKEVITTYFPELELTEDGVVKEEPPQVEDEAEAKSEKKEEGMEKSAEGDDSAVVDYEKSNEDNQNTEDDATGKETTDDSSAKTEEDATLTEEGGKPVEGVTKSEEEVDNASSEPAKTEDGDNASSEPAKTEEGDNAISEPAKTEDGDNASSEPAKTEDGDNASSEPAKTEEGGSPDDGKSQAGGGEEVTEEANEVNSEKPGEEESNIQEDATIEGNSSGDQSNTDTGENVESTSTAAEGEKTDEELLQEQEAKSTENVEENAQNKEGELATDVTMKESAKGDTETAERTKNTEEEPKQQEDEQQKLEPSDDSPKESSPVDPAVRNQGEEAQ